MSRGIARERQVRDLLLADDWWVARAAGSLGDADLVALRRTARLLEDNSTTIRYEARLIEVKSTHRGPYHSFGPKDRADLIFAAKLAGAEAWLCWWPPRDKPHWIPSSAWPTERVEAHRFECVIDESAGLADA